MSKQSVAGRMKELALASIKRMDEQMKAEAFAAGERKGRIEGLKLALEQCGEPAASIQYCIEREERRADRLEREEKQP